MEPLSLDAEIRKLRKERNWRTENMNVYLRMEEW